MRLFSLTQKKNFIGQGIYYLLLLFFTSCTITKKASKDRPYVVKNSFEVKGGNFTKTEKSALLSRLSNQLDDSSKVPVKDVLFFLQFIIRPPVYDSGYAAISAANMQASMFHLGYYNARVTFTADTSLRRVHVHYIVDAGKPTLIDTVSYRLRKPDLQEIANQSKHESILLKNNPITKAAVLGEIVRLVDTFRNNGYYKFTAAELKVRGDTTIEALTSVSEDPFEQLRLLTEAQQKRDSPQIKLAVVLNVPDDTTKLNKYFVNKIYILPDFRPGDNFLDTISIRQHITRNFIIRNHERLFKTRFLARNITLKSGDIYRQDEYYKTLGKLSTAGVWQSVNIQVVELPDTNKVDLVVELVPAKKFGFEVALEGSYSATSNTNNAIAGNLFGISANFSLVNRNIGKEAIRMTHSLRAGIELNNNSRSTVTNLINSNELSYRNSVVFPRLITPFPYFNRKNFVAAESFINTNLSYNNRLNLFILQSVNLSHGYSWLSKKERRWTFRIFNAEFSYLFNQSDSFKRILGLNPFLKYSYNTAYVVGMGGGFSNIYRNPRHLKSESKERSIKFNLEESGLTWARLGIAKNYLRQYIKTDAEYKYTVTFRRTALAFRLFAGVGLPLARDTTLPFFKQYFGGGSNSMRGWPVRGIGRGAQPLISFQQKNIFNDRTGDMQLEGNAEYRYDIARIIPNTLTLRGALFADVGNIWNIRNSKADGSTDSAQFKFSNLYKQLGLSAGTGFRLDFNYFILRLDLGFRFKRPELSYINDGWKAPPIGFDDFFKKLFSRGANDQYRRWRYENFNFTIGISYPF